MASAAMSRGHTRIWHPPMPQRDGRCEMTDVSRLESKYDTFLFASLCEDDGLPLSVLSAGAARSRSVARGWSAGATFERAGN